MFKLRETQENLAKARRDKVELEIENDRLKEKVKRLESDYMKLKEDIESEHLENYNHHKTLLAIRKEVQGAYGSYMSILEKLKNVKKELAINKID